MGFLEKMFGRKSSEELRQEADQLFEQGQHGQAKLAYERALDRGRDAGEEVRAELRARIDACCDEIARRRIAQGRAHLDEGEPDLAREELEGAADTAVSEEVLGEARRLLDGMERRDAVERAQETDLTDEDKLAAIAGSWEDDQDEEYSVYGDDFTEALLDLHDGRYVEARDKLEALLGEVENPLYLWLEVGRARLLADDPEGGEKALRTFLLGLEPEEGGEARRTAHSELARLADERGDEDAAIAELSAAVEALPEDPRPYLTMGVYLRSKGHASEAVEVLEAAVDLMGESRPEWRVLQELGLAHAGAGNDEEAVRLLETVIAMLVARQHYDFPPDTTVPLARLHEKHGRVERAADLFRSLSRGSDRQNHLAYHLEAARLLSEIDLDEEARRMLQRAAALAKDDAEATAKVAERMAALERGDEAAPPEKLDDPA